VEKAEWAGSIKFRRRLLEPLTEWIAFSTAEAVRPPCLAGQILRTLTSLRQAKPSKTWTREAMESATTIAQSSPQVWRDTMNS
jgi:hypothetical protein